MCFSMLKMKFRVTENWLCSKKEYKKYLFCCVPFVGSTSHMWWLSVDSVLQPLSLTKLILSFVTSARLPTRTLRKEFIKIYSSNFFYIFFSTLYKKFVPMSFKICEIVFSDPTVLRILWIPHLYCSPMKCHRISNLCSITWSMFSVL